MYYKLDFAEYLALPSRRGLAPLELEAGKVYRDETCPTGVFRWEGGGWEAFTWTPHPVKKEWSPGSKKGRARKKASAWDVEVARLLGEKVKLAEG